MQVPFYFDYACPWAYLASCRVESYFRDFGVEIDFRPMLLSIVREPVAEAEHAAAASMGARKRAHAAEDLRHWAELCGAELSPDARRMRPRSRLLAQAALVAQDAGCFRAFHYPAFRARWAEARDIADPGVVCSLLDGAGLNGSEALERAQSPELVDRIERCSREAIERGVFGAPTLFIGNEMFWGNDRFEVARHYLLKACG